jgi:hypothetical protein
MPAGNVQVSVVAGVLHVVGDALANQVIVREDGAPGDYLLLGQGNTMLNGQPAGGGDGQVQVSGVTSMLVEMGNAGAGTDSLRFQGDSIASTALAGDINIGAQDALSVTLESDAAILGRLTIRHAQGGPLNVAITGLGTRVGSVEIYDGDADSTVWIGAGAQLDLYFSFQGPQVGTRSEGVNTVTVTAASVGTFVSVIGGSSQDSLTVNAAAFVGDTVELDSYDAAAASPDALTVVDATVLGHVIHKGITSLLPDSASTTSAVANVAIRVESSSVAGGLSVNDNLGAAGGTIDVQVLAGASLGFLSVETGQDQDSVVLRGGAAPVLILGNTHISQGAGDDELITDAARLGSSGGWVFIVQGAGADRIRLQDAPNRTTEIRGDFLSSSNLGDDTVSLGFSGAQVGQAVFEALSTFNGGDGFDALDRTPAVFVSAAPVIQQFEMVVP